MKKKSFTAAVAALLIGGSLSASAQLSAGHIMLTGSAGYTSGKDGTGDRSNVRTTGRISPQVGYFVAENLAIGLGLSYSGDTYMRQDKSNSGNGTSAITETSVALTYGPFVRYYKPVGERAAFFGQLGLNIGNVTDSQKLEGSNFEGQKADKDVKYSLLGASLSPGFTFFPTDHFGLEISMGGLSYGRSKLKDKPEGTEVPDTWEDDNTETSLDASFGLQGLSIGATWYLGGK